MTKEEIIAGLTKYTSTVKCSWDNSMVPLREVEKAFVTLLESEDLLKGERRRIIEQIREEDRERIHAIDRTEHMCRFNDAPQTCECYYKGIDDALATLSSKQK